MPRGGDSSTRLWRNDVMRHALGLAELRRARLSDAFFQNHFESTEPYVPQPSAAFRRLLTLDDVDRLLAHSNFRTTEIFVVNASRKVSVEDFPSPRGSSRQRCIDSMPRGDRHPDTGIDNYHPPRLTSAPP